jgi:predicted TIM-barrel fold metal-dependent hydrolase
VAAIVIDHFGGPQWLESSTETFPPGFQDLLDMVTSPYIRVYVKVSAPYRFASDWTRLRPLFDALYQANPDCLLFATD